MKIVRYIGFIFQIAIIIAISSSIISLLISSIIDNYIILNLFITSEKYILFISIVILLDLLLIYLFIKHNIKAMMIAEWSIMCITFGIFAGRYGLAFFGINEPYKFMSRSYNQNGSYEYLRHEMEDEKIIPRISKRYNLNGNLLTEGEVKLYYLNNLYWVMRPINEKITDKLIIINYHAAFQEHKPHLLVTINTKASQKWDCFVNNDRSLCSNEEILKTYEEANTYILYIIRYYFPMKLSGISDDEIEIYYCLEKAAIAKWQYGKLSLL